MKSLTSYFKQKNTSLTKTSSANTDTHYEIDGTTKGITHVESFSSSNDQYSQEIRETKGTHGYDFHLEKETGEDGQDGNDSGSVNEEEAQDLELFDVPPEGSRLKRDFKKRHVDMMAIGGAIGTGLIIGTGTALKRGGPASMFISFIFTGSLLIVVLLSLSEMAAFAPMDKSFSGYAAKYVDPAYGYATGWNYFYKYSINLGAELSAIGLVIQYWRPDLNAGIFISVFLVVLMTFNYFSVRYFGEVEFWGSVTKLLVLFICYVTAIVITSGGGPKHQSIGFQYWRENAFVEYLVPGATGRFLGFWACTVQSCFAYTGSETIGIYFGEAPNPRKTIPGAARNVLFRICGFYIVGALLIGLIISPKDPSLASANTSNASGSPFVIAFENARIRGMPDFINAMLLVFISTAANANIFINARTMYGLARDGQAPKLFMKVNKFHVPYYGAALGGIISLIAYMECGSTSAANVFGYLTSSVTVFGILNWISILISYIRYRKGIELHNIPHEAIPFKMWWQPYPAYIALFFICTITFFFGYSSFVHGFHYKLFLTSYVGLFVYLGNIFLWKFWKKTKKVDLLEMKEFYTTNAERNLRL